MGDGGGVEGGRLQTANLEKAVGRGVVEGRKNTCSL